MKVEWRTILGAAGFLGLTAFGYWFWAYYDGSATLETAGIAMLIFGGCAYGMLFGYLLLQYLRRHRIPRPEDRFDATQADGAGEVGYFPSASIWPVGAGLGMVFAGVGSFYGFWYLIIGAILFMGAVIGWVVEAEAPRYVGEDLEGLDGEHAPMGGAQQGSGVGEMPHVSTGGNQ